MSYEGGTLGSLVRDAERITKAAGRQMAQDLGQAFRDGVESNTPVQTRRLRESYRVSGVTYRQTPGSIRWSAWAWQGRVWTDVDYAPYVEYGTGLWGPHRRKYPIRPRKVGGVLAFEPYTRTKAGGIVLTVENEPVRGGTVFARLVMHPGSPGQAMFRSGAAITEARMDHVCAPALRMWRRRIEASARRRP